MSGYTRRMVDSLLLDSLDTFGAVIIEGPRAVGKTTTGLQLAKSSVRLDSSPELSGLAEASPRSVLTGDTPRLIDEWQLAPTLWNAVRHEVDQRGAPGQFILTGSATPADDVTRHSGAGRFRRVTLRPMSLAESGEGTNDVALSAMP
ncbi:MULTISPECIES: ATP-binding protein [unclassified Isoptericola]|uniref:ATP-binding protein n=1 Tax=unclassified Isoptericola TaxID=2623355 RepID=UPI0035EF6CBC